MASYRVLLRIDVAVWSSTWGSKAEKKITQQPVKHDLVSNVNYNNAT